MALKVQKGTSGEEFEKVPEGNHRAVCVAVVDLGEQYTMFKARNDKEQDREGWTPQVYLVFELLDEKREKDGLPHCIGMVYAAFLSDRANLHGVYGSLMGSVPADVEDADLPGLAGKACMVEVKWVPGKKDPSKLYDKLTKVAGPIAQDRKKPPRSISPPVVFDIDDGEEFTTEWLPRIYGKTVQDVIKASKQRSGVPTSSVKDAPAADDPIKF